MGPPWRRCSKANQRKRPPPRVRSSRHCIGEIRLWSSTNLIVRTWTSIIKRGPDHRIKRFFCQCLRKATALRAGPPPQSHNSRYQPDGTPTWAHLNLKTVPIKSRAHHVRGKAQTRPSPRPAALRRHWEHESTQRNGAARVNAASWLTQPRFMVSNHDF